MSKLDDVKKWLEAASHWDNHPDYPVEDWSREVADGDTRQSYKEWVLAQAEVVPRNFEVHETEFGDEARVTWKDVAVMPSSIDLPEDEEVNGDLKMTVTNEGIILDYWTHGRPECDGAAMTAALDVNALVDLLK